MKLEILRKKYKKFVYHNYSYKISKDNLEIFFDFRIEPDIFFKPKIVIENVNKTKIKKVGESVLNNLIFQLGLIEMFSYWKATCSSEIEIKAGSLNKSQIQWFKGLIINGMGQFFYENKISWKIVNSLKILSDKKKARDLKVFEKRLNSKILLSIGGGKDSIVSLELLKKEFKDITSFSLNPTDAAKKIIKGGNCK